MVEIGKTIDSGLQKYTGADLTAWGRRAGEFVSSPNRRAHMYRKLTDLLRYKVKKDQGGRNPVERKAEYINRKVDASGLITYIYKTDPRMMLADTAISIIPKSAEVSETLSLGGQPFLTTGPNVSIKLGKERPDLFHFVATPMGVIHPKTNHDPLLGLAREGKIVAPFKNKSSDSETNEQESGGIRIIDGKLEILPYSQLVSALHGEGMLEQATFVVNSENWRTITELPAYRKDCLFTPLFAGNLNGKDGDVSMFVAIYNGTRENMDIFFEALDSMVVDEGYASWEAACLDFGGVFAGIVQPVGGEEIIKVVGPSIFDRSRAELVDTGHDRTRFLDFHWPKE
jgi:hypothetical protein